METSLAAGSVRQQRAGLHAGRPCNQPFTSQGEKKADSWLNLDFVGRKLPAPREKKVAYGGKPAYRGNP
jgi:hypothetical protein